MEKKENLALSSNKERLDFSDPKKAFYSVIENALEAAVVMNDEGIITLWNSQAEKVFGWSKNEAIGSSLSERLVPEKYKKAYEKGLESFLTTKAWTILDKRIEIQALHKKGYEFPIELTITPTLINDNYFFTAFIRDVCKHKATEEHLVENEVRFKEMTEALRLSEARFRRIFDSNMIGLIFTDLDGAILDANDAFLSMVGFTRGDLENNSIKWKELTTPEYQAVSCKAVEEIKSKGICEPFEKQYIKKNGERIDVLLGSALLSKKPAHAVTYVLDISSRKKIEQRLQTSLENEKSARFEEENAKKRIALLADATKSLLIGRNYDEDRAQLIVEMVVPNFADWAMIDEVNGEERTQLTAAIHRDSSKSHLIYELRADHPIEKERDFGVAHTITTGESEIIQNIDDDFFKRLELSKDDIDKLKQLKIKSYICVPLRARGQIFGALGLVSSSHNFTEEDLILAEELGHRAAFAIDNAKLFEQKEKAIRLRDEFLSIASHELKTPLTPMRLYLSSLSMLASTNKLQDYPIAKVQTMLTEAEHQVDRLGQLVEELLDVSRLNVGKLILNKKEVDLCSVVEKTIKLFQEQAENTGSKLIYSERETIKGSWDLSRLEQIVTNLLSNAIKYGQGKPITIKVVPNENVAKLIVTDQGMGIHQDDQERIYSLFERGVSVNNYGGFGVGLYITRQFVKAHGGNIHVQSQVGQGSTFIVELPYQ